MISYWVNASGRWTIDDYVDWPGQAVRDVVRVRCYEDLGPRLAAGPHPHIFTALDTLTLEGLGAVARIWDTIRRAAPAMPLFNDPRRALQRFDLLCALRQHGVNDFHITRASQVLTHRWFPAFVREAHRHTGALTGLLASRAQLLSALGRLVARGYPLDDLIIVEFVDVREADGLYRKYSIFKVGDVLLPRFVHIGEHWEVKSGGDPFAELVAREERAFFETHPHEAWARRVFHLAGIDFGRIDYGVACGKPQVWEINTGPTLGRGLTSVGQPLDEARWRLVGPTREWFHRQFVAALERLDAQHGRSPGPDLEVSLGALGAVIRPARRRSVTERLPALDRLVRRLSRS